MKFQESDGSSRQAGSQRELEGKCSSEAEIELTIQLGVIEKLWAQTKAGQGYDGTVFSDPQEPNTGVFRVCHGGRDIRYNKLSCLPCLDRQLLKVWSCI